MPKGGLRNPKGGRPLGSKNRIPKPKEAQQRLTEIVAELENGEYLYTTADKKYVGSAMELLQSVYRAESLPVKIRLYAATKAVDIEPRAIPQQEIDAQADQYAERLIAEVAAHRREHIREWDERAHQYIAEGKVTEAQVLLFRPLMWTDKNDAPWVPHKSGHSADTAPASTPQPVVTPRYNGAASPDTKSVDAVKPQPPPATNGHAQPEEASAAAPRGRVSVGRVMFGPPHRSFWLGHHRLDSNEFGEIDISDASPGDIALLEGHGYRSRR